jgi:hypothetical protein
MGPRGWNIKLVYSEAAPDMKLLHGTTETERQVSILWPCQTDKILDILSNGLRHAAVNPSSARNIIQKWSIRKPSSQTMQQYYVLQSD